MFISEFIFDLYLYLNLYLFLRLNALSDQTNMRNNKIKHTLAVSK